MKVKGNKGMKGVEGVEAMKVEVEVEGEGRTMIGSETQLLQ
jgi:hypothetical protein